MPQNVCVFCASSNGASDAYREVARYLGERLAKKNWPLVYGGGSVGLMGEVAVPLKGGSDGEARDLDLSAAPLGDDLRKSADGLRAKGVPVKRPGGLHDGVIRQVGDGTCSALSVEVPEV